MLSNIASGIRTLFASSTSMLGQSNSNEFWHRKMLTYFSKMDMNNDGYVSRSDVKALIKALAVRANLSEQRAFLMQRLVIQLWEDFWCCGEDKGFDYLLPPEEFTDLMKALNSLTDCKQQLEEPLRLLFGVIDLDGNGCISMKEWTTYHEIIGNTAEDARVAFQSSFSGKNEITVDDFVTAGLAYFTVKDVAHSSSNLWGPLL